jgi:hypothetical protein
MKKKMNEHYGFRILVIMAFMIFVDAFAMLIGHFLPGDYVLVVTFGVIAGMTFGAWAHT